MNKRKYYKVKFKKSRRYPYGTVDVVERYILRTAGNLFILLINVDIKNKK